MQKTGRQARNCGIPEEEEDETAVATCGQLCKITQGLQQWLKKMADPFSWVRHRPPDRVGGAVGISGRPESPYDDVDLVRRITAAYRKTAEISLKLSESMWTGWIADSRRDAHRMLTEGSHEDITAILREPRRTQLFLGFDDLVANNPFGNIDDPNVQDWLRQWDYDCLLRLGEAVGAFHIEHPESSLPPPPIRDTEEILLALDRAFGFKVQFPNPFAGEVGLQTERGVAVFRAIQSLYQAWRICQIAGPGAKILEIGGGLGRTAFFARQFGINNYTIIDLPLTCVASSYFLGRTLGADNLRLFGESEGGLYAVLPPSSFFTTDDRYDLIVNFDSMTEMGAATAQEYWRAITNRTSAFLSINHEGNEFTIHGLINSTQGLNVIRTLYWLRRGYVEELVVFSPSRSGAPAADLGKRPFNWFKEIFKM